MPLDYSEFNAYDVDQQIQADPVTRRQLTAITQGTAPGKFSFWMGWAVLQLVIGAAVVIEVVVQTHAFTNGTAIAGSEIISFVVIALVAAMVALTMYMAIRKSDGGGLPERRAATDTLIGIYITAMRVSPLNPDFVHSIEASRGNGRTSDTRHSNVNGDENSAWS